MDSKPSEFYRSGAVLQTKMGMAVVCHRAGGYPTCENRKGRGSLSWAVQKSGPPRVKSLRKAEQARRVDRDCGRAAIYGRVDAPTCGLGVQAAFRGSPLSGDGSAEAGVDFSPCSCSWRRGF